MFGFFRKKYDAQKIDDFFAIIFRGMTVAEFLSEISKERRFQGLAARFRSMYQISRSTPDISDFRVGPNYFASASLDWIVLATDEGAEAQLVGHGVMARVDWDGTQEALPTGWADSLVRARQADEAASGGGNTAVGLFINVEKDQKRSGAAEKIILLMKDIVRDAGLRDLIIPLRPPVRYQRDYVEMDFEQFAAITRDDGAPLDYWVRVHKKVGAKVIAVSRYSHQHVIPQKYIANFFEIVEVKESGDLIAKKGDEFYFAALIKDHNLFAINQGCVWVSHFKGDEDDL